MSDIVDFYVLNKKNVNGISLEDFLKFSIEYMEYNHEYVQWIFPLPEKSSFSIHAPVLDAEDYYHIIEDNKIFESFQKDFINNIDKYISFLRLTNHWIVENNHNHMRITRLIKSCSLFFGGKFAKKIYSIIIDIIGSNLGLISEKSKRFWEESIYYGLRFEWN